MRTLPLSVLLAAALVSPQAYIWADDMSGASSQTTNTGSKMHKGHKHKHAGKKKSTESTPTTGSTTPK